ncbi:MAG: hypothetical protein ACRCTZ_21000 [Sarcina sp.]
MSKIENKELKVKSFRVDEDTFAKFKEIASSEFGNQSQCLEALINIYETEESKSVLIGRQLEIESFQDYINKINRLFVTSLQLSSDAEERAKEGFVKKLEAKDEILIVLKTKMDSLKDENIMLKNESKKNKNEFSLLQKQLVELESAKNTLTQLSNRNYDLVSKYELELQILKEENDKLKELDKQIKEKDKELTDIKLVFEKQKNNTDVLVKECDSKEKNINEYKMIIDSKNTDLRALQALIESLKREHLAEIDSIITKKDNETTEKLNENEKLLRRGFELDKRELELKIKELELQTK